MFRTVRLSIIRSFSLYTQDGTQFHPDTAHKLSANLYDIYHCHVYSDKLLMTDRGTVRNMVEFHSKSKCEKFVHIVGFIITYLTWFMVTLMSNECLPQLQFDSRCKISRDKLYSQDVKAVMPQCLISTHLEIHWHIIMCSSVGKTTTLTFRHRASSILGQAFRYSPENAFYIFNQQIYFIIWYLLDCVSLI